MWIIQTCLNENIQLGAVRGTKFLTFQTVMCGCDVIGIKGTESKTIVHKQNAKHHYDLVSCASNFGNFWVTWGRNLKISNLKQLIFEQGKVDC